MNTNHKVLCIGKVDNLELLYHLIKGHQVLKAYSAKKGIELLDKHPGIINIYLSHESLETDEDIIRKAKEKYPEKDFFVITHHDMTNTIIQAISNNLLSGYIRNRLKKQYSLRKISMSLN